MQDNSSTEFLSTFLKGELTAIEAYSEILDSMAGSGIRLELTELRSAHARRVRKLRRRLRQLGNIAGRGGLKPAFEFSKKNPSDDLGVLQSFWQAENAALDCYQRGLNEVDDSSQAFITEELLPDQESTESVVRTLLDGLADLVEGRVELFLASERF